MKSVLISIQPYWVFLIIAQKMGWEFPREKTIEVRKDYPKDKAWNKVTYIYCGKNRTSFNRIPKAYQPFMKNLLGKVIGEFVCDGFYGFYTFTPTEHGISCNRFSALHETCLKVKEIREYANEKPLYGWHISDLKIYDKPKEFGEFFIPMGKRPSYMLERPPQSWCYVEELK